MGTSDVFINQNESEEAILSQVIETETITTVFSLVETYREHYKEILIVFDLDNTVIEKIGSFGTSEHLIEKGRRLMAAGMVYQDILHTMRNEYMYLTCYQLVRLVDSKMLFVLEYLKNVNIKSMGLTARPMYVAQKTIMQLKALGIGFNFIPSDYFYLYLKETSYPAFYDNAICFCDQFNKKGDVLMLLFERFSYRPDMVLFVDDQVKEVNFVKKKMAQEKIPFVGIRYSACDQAVNNFNFEKAEKECQLFKEELLKRELQHSLEYRQKS